MNRRVVKIVSAVGLAAAGSGCQWPEKAEAPSRIVERVERAGARSVRDASDLALGQWFRAHSELATEVNGMCAERAHDADVPGRTEARVCAAVASFHEFTPSKLTRGGKGYDCCSR